MIFTLPALFKALWAFELPSHVSNLHYSRLYKGEHTAISIALFLCMKPAANPISRRLDLRVVGARREGADAEQQ